LDDKNLTEEDQLMINELDKELNPVKKIDTNKELVQKDIYHYLDVKSISLIKGENLSDEDSIFFTSDKLELGGIAEIEDSRSIQVILEDNTLVSFNRIKFGLVVDKELVSPLSMEDTRGKIWFSFDEYNEDDEPILLLYIPENTFNDILNEFNNGKTEMKIAVLMNVFVPKDEEDIFLDWEIEKFIYVNSMKNKCILLNYTTKRELLLRNEKVD